MSKILVVDDDEDILFTVDRILTKNHFDVTCLSDCRKMVQTAQDMKPDLILLDINLGYCDGRKLCLDMKSKHRFGKHILLFSANSEMVKGLSLYGADDFIEKPFDIKRFVETIRQHITDNTSNE